MTYLAEIIAILRRLPLKFGVALAAMTGVAVNSDMVGILVAVVAIAGVVVAVVAYGNVRHDQGQMRSA